MKRPSARSMAACALFVALTAVLSQIAIPIGPVPINLATFSVFCAGALLGARAGCVSQFVYVLLGLVGVPVFSMFRSGPNVLVGPTGGYIIGYVLAAWLTGFIADRSENKSSVLVLAMLGGFCAYMLTGTVWYMFSTRAGLVVSLMTCVIPFLPGEAVKIAAAVMLAKRLRPVLNQRPAGG